MEFNTSCCTFCKDLTSPITIAGGFQNGLANLKFSDAKAQKLLETVGIDATSMSFKDEVINGRSTLGAWKTNKKSSVFFGGEEMWEDSPPQKEGWICDRYLAHCKLENARNSGEG